MAKGYYPDLEDEEDASPEEETQSPPNYSGAMPYADENPPYSTPTDPRFRLPNSMPPAEDEPPPEAPRGYAAVLQPGFTRGGMGVPPLRMTDRGPVLSDESGNPITDGTGSPVSLSQYSSRMMDQGGRRQSTMTPEQEAASFNSGLRWGPANAEQADLMTQAIGQQHQRLQGLIEQAQQSPYLTPAARAQAIGHLLQQQGQLVEHYHAVQAEGNRHRAIAAGMHPDYGTPQGPDLDPRQRQQLAEAEQAVQQVRNAADLSTEQKVTAVTALRRKIEQLDPAGRYRNGQNPMSPAEKFAAQNVTFYPEHGLALAVDAKGQPHWQALPAEKATKREPRTFDEMPLKDKDKLVHDEMREYNIAAPEAASRVKARFAAHAGGMDQGQQVEDHGAILPAMRFLHGDQQLTPMQLQQLATRLPRGYVEQLQSDANEDIDEYQRRMARQRADAIANPGENGRVVVTGDPETMKAYQARAKQILAARIGLNVGMGGGAQAGPGMVAPAPLLTAKQRTAQEAEVKKKATEDAKAAEKNKYVPPDDLHLRTQALRELEAGRTKDDLGQQPPITPEMIDAHSQRLRDAHKKAWDATHGAQHQGPGDVQGTPLGTTREPLAPKGPADIYFESLKGQAGRANDAEGQQAADYVKEAVGRIGNISVMPEPVKREYLLRLKLLQKYDPKLVIPAAVEKDIHDVRQPPAGNTFQSAGKTQYGSTGTYVPRKPHDSGFPGFPR